MVSDSFDFREFLDRVHSRLKRKYSSVDVDSFKIALLDEYEK